MSLIQDIRYAVRLLLKDRWFTFIAAAVLAWGSEPTTRSSRS